jgi:hypothetical protein
MTVQDLLDILKHFDADAKVEIACQPNYPFEHEIEGIVSKDGVLFILQGEQLRYGSKELWDIEPRWEG